MGVCPIIGQTTLGRSDFNFSATPGCDSPVSTKIIEDACLGEVSCKIDIAAATSGLTAGLGSCSGAPVFSVAVKCEDAFNAFGLLSFGVIALIGFALGKWW